MKTLLLALALVLTSLELWAQTSPPAVPSAPPTARRLPRFGNTNNLTLPRYPQASVPAMPAPVPGGTVSPGAAATSAAGNSSQSAVAAGAAIAVANTSPEEMIPAGNINFQGLDLNQVLEVYAKFVGRTLIRGALPDAKIILKTETPLTKGEVIQALQAVLALNNISVVNIGDKFVKVLPSEQANAAGAELDRSSSTNLPNMGSYVTHIVQLKYVKPTVMMSVIQPFQKLQGSILPIDDNGILVIRDYAENVKRMLEMIEQIDVSVPAEYISEVIPIRYAKVDEIASALSSLGGGGGATVSIGSSASSTPISGLAGNRSSGGMGGMGGMGGGIGGVIGGSYQQNSGGMSSPFGGNRTGLSGGVGANSTGTPSTGTTFAQRLNSIVNRAASPSGGASGSGQDQIVLFGQTKIIPNESSSTLLIYATRQDMIQITNIIAKLDVPLAQVLIEAIIVDVTLGKEFTLGVSAAQNPTALGGSGGSIVGAGGGNNGAALLHNLSGLTGVATNGASAFASNLGKGFSYFGNIGPNWDVAVTALEHNGATRVIQRPRIQTSQAKPAQFFIGDTIPYITGTYNYGGSAQSSYSQLSVGVELDVTPFINPDGLVVLDIMQEIDTLGDKVTLDSSGTTSYGTHKRTLNAEISVRDRETVILGGFVETDTSKTKDGVPFLQDIPILGRLFTKSDDTKNRTELLVLIRPTVLKTPELAAKNTINEAQRLPGVSAATAEDAETERKLVEDQRKREKKRFNKTKQYDGFFNPEPDDSTNAPASATTDKDSAGFQQKTNGMEMPATPVNVTSAQKKKLDGLLDRYMDGKMTGEEYMAARDKILPPAQAAKLDAQLNLYIAGKMTGEEYMAQREKILAGEK